MVDMRDMADVLRAADVPVVEEGNWQNRGTGGSFSGESIMLHHDASPKGSSSSSADYIIDNLLSQLWLSYNGTWHVIAAGRMNHAGKGSWPGVPTDNANATFIGIETDHTTNEQWTDGQYRYGLRGITALADWLDIRDSASELKNNLIAHKEWAPDRKVDPDPLNMNDLRDVVLSGDLGGAGGSGMANVTKFSRTGNQPVSSPDTWKTLRLDDEGEGALSALIAGKGPIPSYAIMAAVTLTDLSAGHAAWFRFVQVLDYDGSKDTVIETAYPPQQVVGNGNGSVYGQLAWFNNLPGPSDGGVRKVRLQALAPDGAYTVDRIVIRALS